MEGLLLCSYIWNVKESLNLCGMAGGWGSKQHQVSGGRGSNWYFGQIAVIGLI